MKLIDEPEWPSPRGIAMALLLDLVEKTVRPDTPEGHRLIAQALLDAYDRCFCPTNEMLDVIYVSSDYLKSCTEWRMELAAALDKFKVRWDKP